MFRCERVLVIQILLMTILQRDKVVLLLLPQIYASPWKNSFGVRRGYLQRLYFKVSPLSSKKLIMA
jgi:hypothetical protein